MNTLKMIADEQQLFPKSAMWYASDISQAVGRQELFTRQSPQRLKTLREHALIESAISSNRIEGVEIEPGRVAPVILGRTVPRERNEEEVRGYCNALKLVHEQHNRLTCDEKTMLRLHILCRGDIDDAGKYKTKPVDIIEKHANGSSSIRFRSLAPELTPKAVKQSFADWKTGLEEKWAPPVILAAALNLDFLCIHPFRDGNGRVSRLLLLLCCYHAGLEVGRYISLERLIEDNKERYYETLKQSSTGWHQGKHDPWPYINYLLYIIKSAYKEFEERLQQAPSRRGEKSDMVLQTIRGYEQPFCIGDILNKCPHIGIDLIRKLLKQEKKSGHIRIVKAGRNALWERIRY